MIVVSMEPGVWATRVAHTCQSVTQPVNEPG
jgi:hypothetical protein